jgi:hypothetical protein
MSPRDYEGLIELAAATGLQIPQVGEHCLVLLGVPADPPPHRRIRPGAVCDSTRDYERHSRCRTPQVSNAASTAGQTRFPS